MTRRQEIEAYRQRLQQRIDRVDEDVAYRFARAQAQVAEAASVRELDDLLGRTVVDMAAARDAMLGPPVSVRGER